MANGNPGGNGGGGPLMKGIALLATVLSLVVTFLLAPALYHATQSWITDYAIQSYGAWTEGLIAFVWYVACGFIVFSVCKIATMTALWLGHLWMVSSGFGR